MAQKYCIRCGLPIPDGQDNYCSMCYGDIDYETDEYYRKWMEEQYEKEYYRDFERDWEEDYYKDLADKHEESKYPK